MTAKRICVSLTLLVFAFLAVAGLSFALSGARVAHAETYGVRLATEGWTYDGQAHMLLSAEDGYTAYTATYYDRDKQALSSPSDVKAAGIYYVKIVAEAQGDYDAFTSDFLQITVDPRALTVRVDDLSTAYGEAPIALSATVISGNVVAGDADPWTLSCLPEGRPLSSTTDKGDYLITAQGTSADYAVSFVNKAGEPLDETHCAYYHVTARTLTVTPYSVSSTYGDPRAALTAAHAGLLSEEEALPYELLCEVDEHTPVGTYDITYRETGNRNYNVVFLRGEKAYTVTPRAITVVANDKSSVYGDAIEELTAQVTVGNTVNGDSVYTLSCLASGKELDNRTHAGKYDIIVQATGNANYALSVQKGTYTVQPRTIRITIAPATSVYGEKQGALEADDDEVLSGDQNVYELHTTIGDTSDVGFYDINGITLNPDYSIDFTGGTDAYEITPRALTVIWNHTVFTYDGNPHIPTAILGNTVNGDTPSATVMGEETNAGVYTAYVTQIDSANYMLTSLAGVGFTIQKADAVFDLTDVQTVFAYTGETFALEGVKATGETSYSHNAFSEVGEYKVTVTSKETTNYLSGSITITVTVKEAAPVYYEHSGITDYYKVIHTDVARVQGADMTAIFNDAISNEETQAVTVTAKIGDASIMFDPVAVAAIAGNEVRLKWSTTDQITDDLPDQTRLVMDISLEGAPLTKGTATIVVPFAYQQRNNMVTKVYYMQNDGTMTDMNATYENGALTFHTTHFSRYIVVCEDKVNSGTVAGIVIGSLIGGLLVFFVIYWFFVRHKAVETAKKALKEHNTKE